MQLLLQESRVVELELSGVEHTIMALEIQCPCTMGLQGPF